jgi:chromosome segregation ATPase
MNKHKRSLNSPPDPDDTAEMPGLPGFIAADAGTDTWAAPHIVGTASHDELLRDHQQEVEGLRASVSAATDDLLAANANLAAANNARELLEAELAAAKANAQQLEGRLRDQGEEFRIGNTQRDDLALQLKKSRDELAALKTQLEQQEARSRQQAAEREQQDAQRAAAEAQRAREETQREKQRTEQEARRENQLAEQAAQREKQHAELERKREQERAEQARRDSGAHAAELARNQATLAHTQSELLDLRRRVARHQEVLQHTEGRRHVYDSLLRGHEETVADLAAQLELQREQQHALESRLAEQDQNHQTQAQRLLNDGTVALTRAREMESELQNSRQELAAAQAAALVAQRRVSQLETDLADSTAAAGALREQLQTAEAAVESLRGDLAAAEDLIRSREAELQQHAVRIARLESQEAVNEVHERILVCTEGDVGIVHVLGRRTTVGRTPDNDMCIDADFISRHHAVLLDTNTGTIVEDLESTNGVFVNRERVTRSPLKPGDLVTFGRTTFRFLLK